MNKITYTSMRTELSDVLDSLRAGESITITQRGKPDIILTGTVKTEENKKPSYDELKLYLSPDVVKGLNKMGNHVNTYFNSPEIKESIQALNQIGDKINNMSKEFRSALLHTQIKHAHIIKKLEDK